MEWIIGLLLLVVIVLVALYRRSIRESSHLSNYALLILLDEQVHAAQRKGLADFVRITDAKNAGELGLKINVGLIQLASKLVDTKLGTAGLLWKLKTGGSTPARSGG